MILDSSLRLAQKVHQLHDRMHTIAGRTSEPMEREFDIDRVNMRLDELSKKMEGMMEELRDRTGAAGKYSENTLRNLRYLTILTSHIAGDLDDINNALSRGQRSEDEAAYKKLAQALWLLDKMFPEFESTMRTMRE